MPKLTYVHIQNPSKNCAKTHTHKHIYMFIPDISDQRYRRQDVLDVVVH